MCQYVSSTATFTFCNMSIQELYESNVIKDFSSKSNWHGLIGLPYNTNILGSPNILGSKKKNPGSQKSKFLKIF